MSRTTHRARALLLALLASLLGTASPAWAAEVRVAGDTVIVEAPPGEANRIAVAVEPLTGTVTVADAGGPALFAGAGCVLRAASAAVACDDALVWDVEVRLGDGDDTARVDGLGARLLGGDGADALTGGAWGDVLDGGAGADALAGGGGWDRVSTRAGRGRFA